MRNNPGANRQDDSLSSSGGSTACSKVAYSNRNDALLALALIQAKANPHRKEHAAYPCPCGMWHLTTKRPERCGVRGGHKALGPDTLPSGPRSHPSGTVLAPLGTTNAAEAGDSATASAAFVPPVLLPVVEVHR
jgi:hypothetical protein